jgi:hypothetical protein
MTDFLSGLTSSVHCLDGDCSVRYYGKDGGLALGIVRLNRIRKGGKVPQDIITISSMDLNNLIGYIMSTYNHPIGMGELLVGAIRENAVLMVRNNNIL